MATITFKPNSTPYTLHVHFMSGGSLTYDEAYAKGIRHLTQRISDLKAKFEDANALSPLMVIYEPNDRGGTHARYFYRDTGCEYQHREGAKAY
ncbi:hypothetical protein [Sulfuricurvum sp.]|uniref:hypothetical protein n=1 Tax=Sulfuricurvum sp. TaxID=2025608 RepID=UPI003BB2220A